MYMCVKGYMAMYMCVRGYMAMYMCVRGYNNHCFYYYSIRILELFCDIILFCFFHFMTAWITPLYSWNISNVGVKHQPTNQSINQHESVMSGHVYVLMVSILHLVLWLFDLNFWTLLTVIFCFSFYSLTFIYIYCFSYCKMQLIVFFKSRIYWPDFQHWIYLINIKMKCNLVWSLQTMFFGFITFLQ